MGTKTRIANKVIVGGTKEYVRQNSSVISNAIFNYETGRKVATSIVNASRDTNIYGAAARSVAGSAIKKAATASAKVNPITATIATAASIIPDTARLMNGKIDKGEYAKRSAVNVASTGGSLYGGAEGAAIGLACGGPVGAVAGAIVGGIVGGEVARSFAKRIVKLFR